MYFDTYGYEQILDVNDEEVNIIRLFKDANINIQKADIPFVKVMISDSKEMMHTYTKFSEDKRNVIPQTAIGIWNKYEDVAKNYDERFMNQLKKIKNKEGAFLKEFLAEILGEKGIDFYGFCNFSDFENSLFECRAKKTQRQPHYFRSRN